MRGIAAAQVVLLHYAMAFLPGLGLLSPARMHNQWELFVADTPLFFVLNGHASVYLFFLLSGAALTFSFARQPFAVARWTLRRIIRLGLPMAAAILLGAILIRLWPTAHIEAAKITESGWLGAYPQRAPTAVMAIHQILLEGMVAGYSDASLLPAWAVSLLGLDTVRNAFNAPLWTLHLEFFGSLLVLGLVALRAAIPRWMHLTGSIALGAALAASPLVMFVIGHLLAPALLRGPPSRRWQVAGAISLLGGIVLCTARSPAVVRLLLPLLPQPPLGQALDVLHFQWVLAEIFVFVGVALLPAAQRWLARPLARWGGKISFSLYLVHFPVLFTIVSALFLPLRALMPYGVAALLCLLIGSIVSIALAVLFERWVDRPAVLLSRAIRMPRLVRWRALHA